MVEYLKANGLSWREDFTNSIDDNPRNAIRAHVIPDLEKSYPQFVRAAARYASAAQIESDCLADLTRAYLEKNRFGSDRLSWLELTDLPHRAVLRRAIRAACPEAVDWDGLNALEALCHAPRGKIDIGKNRYAERAGDRLYFVPKQPAAIPPVPLSLDGETLCPSLCRIAATPCAPVPIRDDPWRQVLNAAALHGAVVRTRREGDRIRPLGGGDKLLSDYFIDKKIDRPLRDAVPLVAVGGRVHWVCGLGISQEASVKPGDSAVRLECECDTILYNGGKHHAE
ncbi:MAG: tRNA lysidine(34) synthetase TilS [Clostridia bacterium]|nr:tRNA lysidine(34) synthetase TilS [Clostridia bacterium]